jgi:hypothetical protein
MIRLIIVGVKWKVYLGFIVFVVICLIDITPGNLHGYNVYYDKKYLSC